MWQVTYLLGSFPGDPSTGPCQAWSTHYSDKARYRRRKAKLDRDEVWGRAADDEWAWGRVSKGFAETDGGGRVR